MIFWVTPYGIGILRSLSWEEVTEVKSALNFS